MKELEDVKLLMNNMLDFEKLQLLNAEVVSKESKTSRQLIKILLDNKDITIDQLYSELYQNIKPDAIRKLLSRLTIRIFDIISNENNIRLNTNYDSRAKEVFSFEKKLLLSDLLRLRGMYTLSEKLLNSLIESAKELELYDLLVFALNKKLKSITYSVNVKEIEAIGIEIEKYQKFAFYLQDSIRFYYYFVYNFGEATKAKPEIENEIIIAIQKLEDYSEKSKSLDILYYLTFLKITKLSLQNNFESSIYELNGLLNIYKNSKKFISRLKHGNVLLNLAILNRQSFNFDLAEFYLKEGEKLLVTPKQNFLYIYEQYFLCYFFDGNNKKCKYYFDLFVSIINSYDLKKNFHRKAAFYSLVQSILKNSDFDSSSYLTFADDSKKMDLFSLHFKILQILKLIDEHKFDTADYAMEAFRKYYSKVIKNMKIPLRYEIIIKLLKSLSNSSYNFKVFVKKHNKEIIKLTQPENSWHPNAYELIVFEEWILAKAADKEYNHAEVMAKMKRKYLETKSPLNLMMA